MGGIFARRGIRSHRSGPEFRELPSRLDRLSFFVPGQLLQDGFRMASRVSGRLTEQDRGLASRVDRDLPGFRQANLLLKRVARGTAVRAGVRHRPRLRDKAADVAFDLRNDVDRIDSRHHGRFLGARSGDAFQSRELILLVAAKLFERDLDAHFRYRDVGEVVERKAFDERPESPGEGVRFLPTFGGQVPGHPRKPCRPPDTRERISRFGTGTMPTGEGIQMPQPNCFFAVSDIISGVHGGSQTMSTFASLTPGNCSSFLLTSWWMYADAGQPGAVSVILTPTLPSAGFRSML